MQLFNDLPISIEPMIKDRLAWTGMADEKWWKEACDALVLYEPPPPSLKLSHPERKWELVSALQKTVRRGDTQLALKLVSAMCSLPTELAYFWKRVCTTATEDVGPADNAVMNFVICASKVYTPKKAADFQYKVLCFLTEMMCETDRSRVYCSESIIDSLLSSAVMPNNLKPAEKELLAHIQECGDVTDWAVKNNWRGEGMLKYQMLAGTTNQSLMPRFWKRPEPLLLKGLPSYSYDMHTRVGKSVLVRMTGFKVIKEFFEQNPSIKPRAEALGWALFFEEGGKIDGEMDNIVVSVLEQKFVAAKFGWTFDNWMLLRDLIKTLLDDGAIDKLREKVLSEQGY